MKKAGAVITVDAGSGFVLAKIKGADGSTSWSAPLFISVYSGGLAGWAMGQWAGRSKGRGGVGGGWGRVVGCGGQSSAWVQRKVVEQPPGSCQAMHCSLLSCTVHRSHPCLHTACRIPPPTPSPTAVAPPPIPAWTLPAAGLGLTLGASAIDTVTVLDTPEAVARYARSQWDMSADVTAAGPLGKSEGSPRPHCAEPRCCGLSRCAGRSRAAPAL